ncbi:universal stress protein [Mucilaginibacter gracilis]|nr:universal stress protein [Mucilaginibacter gracilis]
MKTLLIATDFSENAKLTAMYGYELACQLKADVILCNAITIPAEIPQTGFVSWPDNEYEAMMQSSSNELDQLRKLLQASTGSNGSFQPRIRCVNAAGIVGDVVSHAAAESRASLVIAGTHSSTGVAEFVIGNHTRNLIDTTSEPLLIVPPAATFKPVKRIALALDFDDLNQDLATLLRTIAIAKLLDAEILLTHIDTRKQPSLAKQEYLNQTLAGLAKKTGYAQIKTLLIEDKDVEAGLNWLCEHGNIQMLAMAHHAQGFFLSLFKGSHTKKMSDRLCLPMLVLSAGREN